MVVGGSAPGLGAGSAAGLETEQELWLLHKQDAAGVGVLGRSLGTVGVHAWAAS